jgi:hypothetical protein
MGAPASAIRLLIAFGAIVVVSAHGVAFARAEIFDGSGFQAISWDMHIGDVERMIGSGVSRLRNQHSDYAYLRAASYQYLGCQYELLLNFEGKGSTLSSIVLTHPGGAKAAVADQSCREGLSRLKERIGRPMSVSDGVQMWRLKHTTVTVMEGRRGEVQIRYTVTRPFTE